MLLGDIAEGDMQKPATDELGNYWGMLSDLTEAEWAIV